MGKDQCSGKREARRMRDIVGVDSKHLGNYLDAGDSFQRRMLKMIFQWQYL